MKRIFEIDFHRRAQDLASDAALAIDRDPEGARILYCHAATLEMEALKRADVARSRARSVLAVSCASLMVKAARLGDDEHARLARAFAKAQLQGNHEPRFVEQLQAAADEAYKLMTRSS